MDRQASELGKDIAHAMNLFAHPLAGWAAATAVGMGVATQMWGLWAGAMAGAMENAGRMGSVGANARDKAETVAAVKAKAAAVSLMAEAQSLADEVSLPPRAVSRRAAKAAGKPVAAVGRHGRKDDLKRIPGVGPKLEQVLNGLGIWTFDQVAGWSAADIAWVEEQLGLSGRIGRDGWVAQAAELVREHRG